MRKKPQKQGAQDGACGFYSIGNALSILCPKIPVDDIFCEIFGHYKKNGCGSHFVEGMYRNKLNDVLNHTVKALNDEGQNIEVKRPFWADSATGINNFKDILIGHFENGRKAVAIIGYEYCKHDPEEDSFSHWTTIKKITPRSLYTFDSSNERKCIPFSMCRVWDDKQKHKARPYKIDTPATFLLWRRV